jgi:hypothetical protein
MNSMPERVGTRLPTHSWLKQLKVAVVPGPTSAILEEVIEGLLGQFQALGHEVQPQPRDGADLLLTSARYGEPVPWRKALFFTARKRYNLEHNPTILTLVHLSRADYQAAMDHFRQSLAKDPIDPADFQFPGLAPQAYRVLVEQGRRGGPLLALERQLQAQAKSIRLLLVVGDDRPLWAHHFDLVGAHPTIEADHDGGFYEDLVLRTVTVLSTKEITDHEVVDQPIPLAEWRGLSAPLAMIAAGPQLGQRSFFTEMVRIADLVQVPAVADGVASQYSEGCFATWEPALGALIATVTGSARPVDKDQIGEDDLAVIVGVRPDGVGAQVRQVAGKRNDPPSSEAVELMDMDRGLPSVELDGDWEIPGRVPVVRSKLHGHRGVASFDPRQVEHVPLDPPYYHYPVSCATEAQAQGIKAAFARAESLRDPDDPRQLAFTVLPGHGVVIAEKWAKGKAPFQAMWEAMDQGSLVVENRVPQGPLSYVAGPDGRMVLKEG